MEMERINKSLTNIVCIHRPYNVLLTLCCTAASCCMSLITPMLFAISHATHIKTLELKFLKF
jgi:hypothetical protein